MKALGVALGLVALALPLSSHAGASARCAAPWPGPYEIETLHVTPERPSGPNRVGHQILIRLRVTRAVEPGHPASPLTEEIPIALAFVWAELESGGKVLDGTGNETDQAGWVSLPFNLPTTTPLGPVAIRATARYSTIGSVDCTEPILVETGTGYDDEVLIAKP